MIASLIMLGILFVSLGSDIARHGQPRKGTYNGWVSLIGTAVVLVLWWQVGILDPVIKAALGHG